MNVSAMSIGAQSIIHRIREDYLMCDFLPEVWPETKVRNSSSRSGASHDILDLFTMHHVSLYVRDVHASASFYGEVLGLREIQNRVGKSHIRWFSVDGFRTIHLIGGAPEAERPRPLSTHLAFASKQFETALAQLSEHEVRYVNLALEEGNVTTRADGIRQIYFQDPDGHWIEINDAGTEP